MKKMGTGQAIRFLCDADTRSACVRLRVKVPKLTIEQAEKWWNEESKKEADARD